MLSSATFRGATFDEQNKKAAAHELALRKARVKGRAQKYTGKEVLMFAGWFISARFRRVGSALKKLVTRR